MADNRLSVIRKHGQKCGKCHKPLELGTVATWAPGGGETPWRCVEGPGACCPRTPEEIEAKKTGKPHPVQADTPFEFVPAPQTDAELVSDMVFPTPTPASETPAAGVTGASDPIGLLASAMFPHMEARLKAKVDAGQVQRIVDERTADLIESAIAQVKEWLKPVQVLEVRLPDSVQRVEGAHPKLADAVQLLQVCNAVYIYGPPGAGKTFAAEQIAKVLNARLVPFQAGKLSTESIIRSFTDANGKAQDTAFMDAYSEDNTLIFLDEFDRWPTHLQVLLNTALANGYLQSRQGRIDRGKNFILAAGNTNLRGRDEYFPEAQASEFSTLDRFACLNWPYDEAHEDSIAESINPKSKAWVAWIRKIRPEALSGKRGKVLATPRAMYDGAKALRCTTLTVDAIADAFVFKGIDKATRDYFVSAYPLPSIPRSDRDAFKQRAA
jgi:hypothetical protein